MFPFRFETCLWAQRGEQLSVPVLHKQPDRYLPPKQWFSTPKRAVGLSGQETRSSFRHHIPTTQQILAAPLLRSRPSPARPAAPAPALAQHRERCCERSDSRQEVPSLLCLL